jgi:hypothetical protein
MTHAALSAVPLVTLLVGLGGCGSALVFGTATKFGVDISQRADRMIEVSLGYDRVEFVSIPASGTDARGAGAGGCRDRGQPAVSGGARGSGASGTTGGPDGGLDTYSVMGTFKVTYDTPWGGDPVVIRQFFATGLAARQAACQPKWQEYFGRKTGEIEQR